MQQYRHNNQNHEYYTPAGAGCKRLVKYDTTKQHDNNATICTHTPIQLYINVTIQQYYSQTIEEYDIIKYK